MESIFGEIKLCQKYIRKRQKRNGSEFLRNIWKGPFISIILPRGIPRFQPREESDLFHGWSFLYWFWIYFSTTSLLISPSVLIK